jgi:hypothetical protein
MDEDNLVKAREISDPNRGADMGIAGGVEGHSRRRKGQ